MSKHPQLKDIKNRNRIIIAGGLFLSMIFILTAIISIYLVRQNAEKEWSEQLERITLSLSEHSTQTFFSANTALDNIVELIEFAKVENKKSYQTFTATEKSFQFLQQKLKENPILDVATFIADDGKVLNFSRSYPPPDIDLSDRDYFKWLSSNNDKNTFYSEPVKNKGNGKWVFYLAKRINNSQNQFLGVVLIGISAEVFSDFYKKMGSHLGDGISISLYRNDYTLMTRWPFVDDLVGQKNMSSATKIIISDRKLKHGFLVTDMPRFTTNNPSEPRMVASRVVNNYPFITTVTIPEAVYAPPIFVDFGWILGLLIFGLGFLFVCITYLLRANNLILLELSERIAAETELGNAKNKLETLAYTDSVTGFPNRTMLVEKLNRSILECKAKKMHCAIFFIDLDNFKTLNDQFGHDRGDLLLQKVAKQLMECIRRHDLVTRFGGDEFVLLLTHLDTEIKEAIETVNLIAIKILNKLSETYYLDGIEYRSSASIGISLFGMDESDPEKIIKEADIAMYQAKMDGKNSFRLFNDDLQKAFDSNTNLIEKLKNAINKKQFTFFYQPQFDQSLNIVGAEALIRWEVSDGIEVLPDIFIPAAEKNGLINDLGKLVIENAAIQLHEWSKLPKLNEMSLSINISAKQIQQREFLSILVRYLKEHLADFTKLRLELTESIFISNFDEVTTVLAAIKSYGIKLSLDDFGTGYSSLSYLRKLPIDELKIDKFFIDEISEELTSRSLIVTIISLAKSMGIKITAEGVETKEQEKFLRQNDCDLYQGYLYCKPLPINEFIEFVNNWKSLPDSIPSK